MSDTRRIVINHGLTSPKETEAAAAARKAREQTAATVRARRKQIHEQAKRDVSGIEGPPQREPTPVPPVREDIDSIEIPLPDGRVIEYGPPRGVSLQDRILRMYSGRALMEGGPDPGITEYRMTRVLMGVRAIDGKSVSCNDLVQRTQLANRIGDVGLDLLHYYDRLHWPPMTEAELPVIKKNYRTQPSEGSTG